MNGLSLPSRRILCNLSWVPLPRFLENYLELTQNIPFNPPNIAEANEGCNRNRIQNSEAGINSDFWIMTSGF
jgi:hypothetical protein